MPHAHAIPDAPPSLALRPLARIGGMILDLVHYLGGMGVLALSAARSVFRPREDAPSLAPAVTHQLERIFRFGLPLVALVHVGLGSFLAMQAYFGATFLEGIGPVVGVGLVRNVGPLMSAMVMAGLFAALYTPELRGIDRDVLDRDPNWLPDRDPQSAPSVDARPPVEHGRLAASRMIAAMLAGPVMGVWASLVGIAVGYGVAAGLLKLSTSSFFDMFFQMLWGRDVVGVVVKGVFFGLAAAWFPCFEGLRHGQGTASDPDETPRLAVRAACLAGFAVLFINSTWFLLFYHAGPAFGPTLLTPPMS